MLPKRWYFLGYTIAKDARQQLLGVLDILEVVLVYNAATVWLFLLVGWGGFDMQFFVREFSCHF